MGKGDDVRTAGEEPVLRGHGGFADRAAVTHGRRFPFDTFLRDAYGVSYEQFRLLKAGERVRIHQEWLVEREFCPHTKRIDQLAWIVVGIAIILAAGSQIVRLW